MESNEMVNGKSRVNLGVSGESSACRSSAGPRRTLALARRVRARARAARRALSWVLGDGVLGDGNGGAK